MASPGSWGPGYLQRLSDIRCEASGVIEVDLGVLLALGRWPTSFAFSGSTGRVLQGEEEASGIRSYLGKSHLFDAGLLGPLLPQTSLV